MFDAHYTEWTYKRIKFIMDHFGYPYFKNKKILDLGCGHGDVGASFYRLGADVTCVDIRDDNLQVTTKKYQGIKTKKVNLDREWPFDKVDLVIDLGLLCHLFNYEAHLKHVCNSAGVLVLETAVCDSDDPELCIMGNEDAHAKDRSFSGTSSRPTAAKIEKILTNAGMNFKRVDNSKLNCKNYIYDWSVTNSNNTDIGKRRLWVANKIKDVDNKNIVYSTPNIIAPVLPMPDLAVQSIILPSPPPVQSVSPLLPVTVAAVPHMAIPHVIPSYVPYADVIRNNSEEFAITYPEKYNVSNTFSTGGIILPLTASSRRWISKISPLFPNIKIHTKAHSMTGFNKSSESPDLIMCSIDNIVSNKRIFIEEWFPDKILTDNYINKLNNCGTILTSSLLNAQSILQKLPDANVVRVIKPWSLLNTNSQSNNCFIYFEKDAKLTKVLLDSWKDNYPRVSIIGSSSKLPLFANFVSIYEDYEVLQKMILSSKAIIDLSANTYYMSGIIELAHANNIPVITNNHQFSGDNIFHVIQDKNISSHPIASNISDAINKFLDKPISFPTSYDENYNLNVVDNAIKKMLGI